MCLFLENVMDILRFTDYPPAWPLIHICTWHFAKDILVFKFAKDLCNEVRVLYFFYALLFDLFPSGVIPKYDKFGHIMKKSN